MIENQKTRNSNFELLRLLLMFLIVVHHCIVHGLNLVSLEWDDVESVLLPADMLLFCEANSFCIIGVNVFVLISGYFGLKPTSEKILKLLLSIAFYALIFNVGYNFVIGDYKHTVSNLFIFSHGRYWFMTDYFFLMCFTPLINGAFEWMSKQRITLFVILLLVISCYFGFVWQHSVNTNGYSLFQFIMLYTIGKYIRTYDIKMKKIYSILTYVICSLICGTGMYLLYRLGFNHLAWRITNYNNFLVITSAVAVLLLFKNLEFNSVLINKIAQSSLAIYLFQSSVAMSALLYPLIKNIYRDGIIFSRSTTGGCYILLIIMILSLFTVVASIMIDQIQIKINSNLSNYILRKWKSSKLRYWA